MAVDESSLKKTCIGIYWPLRKLTPQIQDRYNIFSAIKKALYDVRRRLEKTEARPAA